MDTFLAWFEGPTDCDAVIMAALAHLWYVANYPFDDGNGRIARAITEMALARSEGSSQRFYSMSAEIQQRRKGYYDILEKTQKGDLDVTGWLVWFLDCLDGAITRSETELQHVLQKAGFWEARRKTPLNDRHRLMLRAPFDRSGSPGLRLLPPPPPPPPRRCPKGFQAQPLRGGAILAHSCVACQSRCSASLVPRALL
jgi:Fic family protein